MAYKLAEPVKKSAQPRVHYLYFGRNLWRSHHGILTVGAVLDGAVNPASGEKTPVVTIAFAFCSPLDPFLRYTERRVELKNGRPTDKVTVIKGGIDIVNARLGLVPMEGIGKHTYTVPLSGTVLQTVMTFFNTALAKADKPKIWQARMLAVAPRQAFYRLGCWNREEFDRLDKLADPAGQEAGFFPLTAEKAKAIREQLELE